MRNNLHKLVSSFPLFVVACFLHGCSTSQQLEHPDRQPHIADAGYQKLEQLLQQNDWQAADRETFHKLLVLSDREDEGWLGIEDVENISCDDWATINRLWQTYSDRRFGFRIQSRIWESVGGTAGQYDPAITLKVGEAVGWRSAEQWQNYGDLTFSLEAEPGHLPATTGNGVSGGIWGGVATIAGRVQACASEFDRIPESLQSAAEREVQENLRAIQAGESCVGCYLVGADLRDMGLSFLDLPYADLRNADLAGASLGAADLRLADLRGANLENAILRQAYAWGASFDGANLNGVDLSCGGGCCTNIQGASFQGASLIGANLDCLDCTVLGERGLVNVNMAGANLTDAQVRQTSFEGVNLCDAILPNGERSQQGC